MAARVSLFPRGHGSVSTASISSWNQGGLEKGDQGMYRVVKVQYSYRVVALWVIYGRVWVPVWVQVQLPMQVQVRVWVPVSVQVRVRVQVHVTVSCGTVWYGRS